MSAYEKLSGYLLGRILVAVVMTAALIVSPAWAGKGGTTTLNKNVIDHLNYIREIEKVAHDVYVTMYDTWKDTEYKKNAEIFNDIYDSEQQHMDTMLKMLEKYNLPDPASDEFGVFNNEALQEKYDDLVAIGVTDYIRALHEVGGYIEELDMIDLQEALDVNQTPVDLMTAYEHLMEGSKNHLRAFVSALEALGFTYDEAQLIDQELFDAIVDVY